MSEYLAVVHKIAHLNRFRPPVCRTTRMNDLLKLSEALGNPHEQRVVHVVGTNGKGSVSLKTSRALQSLGIKTALFTSPHIFSFRERLLVQGEMATEHEVVQLASQVFTQSDRLGLSPTMFEVVTLMGLIHFRNRRVDIAVLEAGMGGARDPTSICQGRHAAITSIGLDHCDVLGSTEEAICREKAGIIQDGLLLIGPTVPVDVVQTTCGPKVEITPVPCQGSYRKTNSKIA